MYTLDFETMKQVMQEHQKTGILYADLPTGSAGINEPCRVEVKIMAGKVASCSIVTGSGRRLTEKESVQKLSRLGQLYWTFVPQQEVSDRPAFPASAQRVILPQRTVYLEQWQMRSWPRLHRSVFALADGTRSVPKIAGILSTSLDLVEKALSDLQSIGVIAMEPQNGRDAI